MSEQVNDKSPAVAPSALSAGLEGAIMNTTLKDTPVFEVLEITPGGFGRKYKIWADGRTEGFDFRHAVINLIQVMANYQMATALEKAEQGSSVRHAVQKRFLDWASRMARLLGKTAKG